MVQKYYPFILFLILCVLPGASDAGNIDPGANQQKYAWSENAGWIDFGGNGYVYVTETDVIGKVWSENCGWIVLDPQYGGVHHDGNGNLSGYAWGENVGWINFNPVNGGVTIDMESKFFSGFAWGENIGWIAFNLDVFSMYQVKTSWPTSGGDVNTDGLVSLEDVILTLKISTGNNQLPPVYSGADVDGDQSLGLVEVIYIMKHLAENIQ